MISISPPISISHSISRSSSTYCWSRNSVDSSLCFGIKSFNISSSAVSALDFEVRFGIWSWYSSVLTRRFLNFYCWENPRLLIIMEIKLSFAADNPPLSVISVAKLAGVSLPTENSGSAPTFHFSNGFFSS
ncbi:hypothetical protein Patl1_06966 [Pistacia atlantica]|uniref:Uncharacterized protein n=1 Tax=Pistacia atlantica TaxID=434234 RepID=A0ACC1AJQ3_9ROSI|nr:hypothetical protein Patl1_06966 [Pistacia atlantica]